MTPDELMQARKYLGLTQGGLERHLGININSYNGRTVRNWESGDIPVPGPCAKLIQSFLMHGLTKDKQTRGEDDE